MERVRPSFDSNKCGFEGLFDNPENCPHNPWRYPEKNISTDKCLRCIPEKFPQRNQNSSGK